MTASLDLQPTPRNDIKIHAVVIVLGDVGRSPRMQYHAVSLLEGGHHVTLVGYHGEDVVPALKQFPLEQLTIVRFRVPIPKIITVIRPLYLVWRIVSLVVWLLYALLQRVPTVPQIDCVIVQNPPAMPLLFVSSFFCWVQTVFKRKRPALIIDWHNLGFSMLRPGRFQQLAKWYETALAPHADGHLTVTKAMKNYLLSELRVPSNVNVVYDCSPAMFRPLDIQEQYDTLQRLNNQLLPGCPKAWYSSNSDNQNLFTEISESGHCRPRPGRPALVMSSTSWTPDEDFNLLLKALVSLDERLQREHSDLKVLVIVTGKGPNKAFFQQEISRLVLHNVAIQTLWLEFADYYKLLACADLGVSLHTSTSGLDLPMKILDMFGCQVPVCAVSYACLEELVQESVNGRTFVMSNELCNHLWTLLQPLATNSLTPLACHDFGELKNYSKALQHRPRWSENWKTHAWPVIRQAVAARMGETITNGTDQLR